MGTTVTDEHSASLHITQPIVDLIINPVTAKDRNGRKKLVQDAVGASRRLARDERKARQTAMNDTVRYWRDKISNKQKMLIDSAGE